MRKHLLTLICALCALSFIPSSLMATDYTIEPNPSGTIISSSIPLSTASASRLGVITQQIYLASELTAEGASAGNITAISFYYGLKSGKTAAQALSRTVQVWILEVPSSGVNKVDSFLVEKVSTQYLTKYKCNGSGKAGTKVFDGTFSTTAITSSDGHKKGTITFDNAFAWDGISNLVVTVADMSNTTVGSDAYNNLGFAISPTAHARFMDQIWNSGTTDNRATLLNDLTNQYGRQYSSGAKSCAEQAVKLRFVPKTTFSIVTPVPVPTSPSAGSITASSATLSWTAAAGADSYEVRYGTTSGSLGAATNVGNVTSYSLSELTDETTYYYQIRTKKGSGYSAWTIESSFTTLAEDAHTHNNITFSKWASTTELPTSGNYYLNDDVAFDIMSSDVTLTGNLNLCLNGKTADIYGSKIIVPSGKTLTIYDNEGGGKITGFVASEVGISEDLVTSLIVVKGGGTLVLKQGTIENTYVRDADGNSYAIYSNGTVRISGDVLINSNDADIYLYSTNVITLDGAISNAEKHTVYKTGGAITSGWSTHMSGEDPRDYFESANSARSVCLDGGEASLRLLLNLSESSLNSSISTSYNQLADVNLTRSLTSSQYNTFCLPFALDDDQLKEFFGAGYDLEKFVSSSLEGDVLNLVFNKVTSLEAGKPYLLQPSVNVANPSFEGVTIAATEPADQTSDANISFHATFAPTELEGGNKNLLFLGADNELFYPASTANIKAFRAYFELKGAAQKAAKRARIVKKEDSATGIDQITNDKSPMTNKIIKDGQLLILRDNKTYNVIGQMVK